MIKITRTLIYKGEEKWVRDTLEKSFVQPDRPFPLPRGGITELERREEEVEEDG